jgi:hypothetical protein
MREQEDLAEARFRLTSVPSAPSTIESLNPTKGEVMKKVRKLVLTTTALVALAVGGAAFAQAQSAGTVAKVSVQQPQAESTMPGDTDNVQSGDQSGPDQGGQAGEQNGSDQGQAGEQESGSESQSEAPESSSSDGPGGHQDESGQAGSAQDTETSN